MSTNCGEDKQTACINPEVNAVLDQIRRIGNTLLSVTSGSNSSSKVDIMAGTFVLGTKDSQSAIKHIGEALAHAANVLTQAVEDQIIEFYRHMKKEAHAEHELLRNTRSLVPSDPSLMKHLQFADAATPRSNSPPKLKGGHSQSLPLLDGMITTSGGEHRTRSPTMHAAAKAREVNVARDSLRSALFLMLEGTMHLTEATRGAIYLKVSEGSSYLRRVCDINAADAVPLDVSPAAGSTIGTVVRHNIGVSIAKSRMDNPESLEYFSSASQAVRSSVALHIHNAVIIPIAGDLGCVIVADKSSHDTSFSSVDEHAVLSLSSMIHGMIKRYPQKYFMEKLSQPMVNILAAHAELPPIMPRTELESSKEKDQLEQCLERMLPGLDSLLPKPNRLVVVKAGPQFAQLLTEKHMEGCERAELSDEDLLESAVPYIKNLESLWRKSIDHMTQLRSDCETWSREMERKNARISELESEGRTLWRQYVALKADVSRLKLSTVPQQLRETHGELHPPSVVEDATIHEGASSVGGKFHDRRRQSSVKPLTTIPRRSSVAASGPGPVLHPKAPLTAR